MLRWNDRDIENRFYELRKDVEDFAGELKQKYNFLHTVNDKEQRELVEKKISELIERFKYRISSLGDDVDSEIEEKNDYIDVLEEKIERMDTHFNDEEDWVQHCIDTLPRKASLGKAMEMEEKLRGCL